jgi:hypothetical protein
VAASRSPFGSPAPPRLDDHGHIVMPRDYEREPSIPQGSGQLVMMAPRGDRALAVATGQVYAVTMVPQVGATAPTVWSRTPDSAAMPVRRLSDIGGEFPTWSATAARSTGPSATRSSATTWTGPGRSYRRRRTSGARLQPGVPPDVAAHPGHPIPRGTVVLRGARAITMRGDEVIENADVVVRDNRIVSGSAPGARCPAGAQGDRRDGPHHRAGLRGHPRPHVEPVGDPLDAAVDLRGEPGVRRDDHPGPADRHHRRADVRRPVEAGDEIPGPPGLLHGPGRLPAARP